MRHDVDTEATTTRSTGAADAPPALGEIDAAAWLDWLRGEDEDAVVIFDDPALAAPLEVRQGEPSSADLSTLVSAMAEPIIPATAHAVPADRPSPSTGDGAASAPDDAPLAFVAHARFAATVTPVPAADGDAVFTYSGKGQTIIIIDDGSSPFYDQSNTLFGIDFADGDYSAEQWSFYSHGSWVADVATDVAADVNVIHLKVFADGSSGASWYDIEDALQWAADYGGYYNTAAVNLSLGAGNATAETYTLLSDEFAALAAQGIFATVAAGNAGSVHEDGVNVVAADPNAIGVSAVDAADRFADFSQRSSTLTDIAALGTDVAIDTVFGFDVSVSGTSFSAPYVAGTAALLQEAALDLLDTRLSEDQFLDILRTSGRDVVGAADVDGYRVADAGAALDFFVENHEAFAPIVDDAFVA